MFAILCTDGRMNISEVHSECCGQKWIPLFVYEENGVTVIPIFDNENVAKSFCKRNLPKDWLKGGILLSENEITKIKEKGWKIREMNYPNKLRDIKNIKIGFEILELNEKPDFILR